MAQGDSITEEYPWGHPVWKVRGKMFAACSEDGSKVTVKATRDQQAVLIQQPSIQVADYVGRYGWVTIELRGEEDIEMAKDLIDESYELVTARFAKRKGGHNSA